MVPGVFTAELDHDGTVTYPQHRGQGPGIADLSPDAVTLTGGAQTAFPGLESEHLPQASPGDLEPLVELTLGIRDREGPGKEAIEEHRTLFHGSLIDEHDAREEGVVAYGVGELVDELTVEQSTVVTQEHEQRRSLVEEFPEGRGLEMVADHAVAALFGRQVGRRHPTVVAPMVGPGRFLLGSRDRRPRPHEGPGERRGPVQS